MKREVIDCEVLIIGSGPGGATTAALLAEKGHDVLIVEEGPDLPIDSAPSYSLEEMDQKYRNGGLSMSFGNTGVTYIEGRCVGGASEVNAALYHRPKASTLREWQLLYQIDAFDPDDMWTWFSANEADCEVSNMPRGIGPASQKLKDGADRLGWSSAEISRFWKYEEQPDGSFADRRQSMTVTMIPRAKRAGARLIADTRVDRLEVRGNAAVHADATQAGPDGKKKKVRIRFHEVFLCCGAVHTPLLLRRSGVTFNVGNSLRLHPMIRVCARFPEPFNDPSWGVPVQQIDEFKPLITLGCSHSSPPHVALWLEGDPAAKQAALAEWQNMGIFYVAAVGSARGTVRNLPIVDEPLVRMNLTTHDMALLGEGLHKLGQVLFEAGATSVFNPVPGGRPIQHPDELAWMRTGLPHGKLAVSTIHLFSSCPMGEDLRECAVDSFGRVHGLLNVLVNDASMLPRSPAVNPQGTIMAVARRNAAAWLARH